MRWIATWLATHSLGIVRISKGVLVAISILIFTTQLQKARAATDKANLRGWYAEVVADNVVKEKAEDMNWPTGKPPITLKAAGASASCSGTGNDWIITYSATDVESTTIGRGIPTVSGSSDAAGG